ncbi:FAD binding domain-containing protein [Purpureocillium lavendulum]|uniref:FAD binding domain-containing protein n=1 Tax=Purpureocillium lavendulum TaxID=1247861 RepID=A0AB34FNA3_9HYPO|nr:FAD binding domain-containing protein [Purpureocillium lavendulum]
MSSAPISQHSECPSTDNMAKESVCTARSAPQLPVIIIGAGISGLLLAQHLLRQGIHFRIFERDHDFATRGVGWGLTLHWALSAAQDLLGEDLFAKLEDTYVDRESVEAGLTSRFPFYDLSTGQRKAATPDIPNNLRVRVTRERLRRLLATGIEIEWRKSFSNFLETSDPGTATSSVVVNFEDGTSCAGRLLVACDGGSSRVRRQLVPKLDQQHRVKIPVCVMGLKLDLSPEQIAPLRALDPFFLQGCSSENDSFLFCSVLDAPRNNAESSGSYALQICVSWPYREGFLGRSSPLEVPESNQQRHELLDELAQTWAEPFRSVFRDIPDAAEIKNIELHDWAPPYGFRSAGSVLLMGDALHHMVMYRGEGANHAIIDVQDFARLITPVLRGDAAAQPPNGGDRPEATAGLQVQGANEPNQDRSLRDALDRYEAIAVDRARPGVLASRRACLDAHDWARIGTESPLLCKRQMKISYDEEKDKILLE